MTAELTFARNLPVWTKLERNGGGSLRFSIGRIDAKPEPAPQPERTIVKVGGYTADPARNAQVGA